MKKSLFTLLVLAACSAAYSAGIAIEIDGQFRKIQCTKATGLKFLYPRNGATKPYYLEFRDTTELPLEWTEYTVTFVPDKSGYVTLGLSTSGDTKKGMNDWIEYDKLQLTNAKLNNPSFEFKSVKGDVWAWRYYTKDTAKFDKQDAADGKSYIAVTRNMSCRQGMLVTAGKTVTIKFMARSGGMTPKKAPAGKPFFSDQTAPKAK
ncbi:MAG: hypothetical protein IKC65_05200 [Lentisphaeria bacterium]|nr:hypothetical protein [Lentisphaeria bacterium]